MVDTFRADKMHGYNSKTRVLTPNYDAFAADATRFAWATVQGTWSLPSHASLLTGVYPTVHKATAHESKLSPTVPFVAEELKHDGYKTGMFSSNGYISSKWGFDRGWDVDRNFIRESLPNSADYLWKTAKSLDHAAAHQEAVRLPRHHRAARRLHAEEGVPGQVLEQALHRPAEAGADGRAARTHQGRASSRSTTTTRRTSRRCTTPRSPAATRSSPASSPTSRRWGSTTPPWWWWSPTTAISSTSTAASVTATPSIKS